MPLRRHIAFFAVLIASALMFVHAVVPHHHRASDLSVCTEEPAPCRHVSAVREAAGTAVLSDAGCDCGCNGVQCAAPLPFTLRCGTDGDDHSAAAQGLLPLFECELCTGAGRLPVPELSVLSGAVSYFVTDARLAAQWTPGSVSGRAPPVL
ncbi:hypothetical protein [Rikenella microfusus]|uniref:hypothetical protein n=1 Tax=Rikenella microfusus TaxID=28139 RepID=UPI003A920802